MKKIRLRTSGGIANLRLEGELDYTELTAEQAHQMERLLESSPTSRGPSRTADAMQYEIWSTDEATNESRHAVISDEHADPETLDVLDELMSRIIDKKRRT